MEKGSQQFSFGTNLAERRANRILEFLGILGREVSESDEFAVRPDRFNGVEFRGIRRQPFHRGARAVFGEELADDFSLMDLPVVHDEYRSAGDASSDTTQEIQDFLRGDVARIDGEEEIEPFTFWRDRDSADNREPVVALPVFENRSFAFKRPGLSDERLEHEARFVNEDDCIFSPDWPVVLSLASSSVATLKPALRSAPLLCAGVSDSSSPMNARFSRHGLDDTLYQTFSRLPLLSFAASTTDLNTQRPLDLSVVLPEAGPSAVGSYEMGDVDGVGLLDLCLLPSRVSLSSAELNRALLLTDGLPLPYSILALRAPSLGAFVSPTVWDFLVVSYIILYLRLFRNANINKKEVKKAKT